VRPMVIDDIPEATDVWERAFDDLRERFNLPAGHRDAASDARFDTRIRHFLTHDGGGAWVSHEGDRVTGLAVALQRERLWVLSMLGVDPTAQSSGVGRALLERALAYGDADGPGIILSSRDPRAMRRYALAGFDLRPAVTAWGRLRRAGLHAVSGVRDGDEADLDLAAHVDRLQRGSARGPDYAVLLEDSGRMLVFDEGARRGYAIVRKNERPVVLAATDHQVATALLTEALAGLPDDCDVEVGWLTASQQWAVRVCLAAGLEVHPVGGVMVRGHPGPMSPYLPNGMSG
jgi:GNAT superfamily N-acetyltransferase